MKYIIIAALLLLAACGTVTAPDPENNEVRENEQVANEENNTENDENESEETAEAPEEADTNTAAEEEVMEELTFQLEAEKQEDTIYITIKLINDTDEPQEITFRSGQRYDLIIRSESGDELYNFAEDMMFTQAIETETIAAGEEFAIEESWEAEGEGPFTIEAAITAAEVNGSEIEASDMRETVTVE